MRLLAVAAIASGILATPSIAADALWRGDAFIFSKSGTCANYDPVGNHFDVRYRPAGLGTNGSDSAMAWFKTDYALGFFLAGGSFNSTAKAVKQTSIWAGHGDVPGFPVTLRFTSQAPAPLLATSNFVNIQGTITNFDFMQTCTVNFRLALGRSTN